MHEKPNTCYVWVINLGLTGGGGGDCRMTKLLERAVAAARSLPPETQDEIARLVLHLAGKDDDEPIVLSAEERAVLINSKAAAARGDFATDDEVRAVWAKHGL
jgi:hypothetical protein